MKLLKAQTYPKKMHCLQRLLLSGGAYFGMRKWLSAICDEDAFAWQVRHTHTYALQFHFLRLVGSSHTRMSKVNKINKKLCKTPKKVDKFPITFKGENEWLSKEFLQSNSYGLACLFWYVINSHCSKVMQSIQINA